MKKVIIFVSILLVFLTASAQSISQQEAMERVVEFLQSAPAKGSPRRAMVSAPKLETVAVVCRQCQCPIPEACSPCCHTPPADNAMEPVASI